MVERDICLVAASEDAKIAEELAAKIIQYRLPKGVTLPSAGLHEGDRRVAVDADGGPFDARAEQLLKESRWLLILCSPQSRQNQGVQDRIAFFKTLHDGERIIPVLVRGEPHEVMPDGFIQKKTISRTLPDGSEIMYAETIEPVASDLRADSDARYRHILRYETTRIIASVLGLHPDDLEQRHRARERRAVRTALAVAAAVSLIASGIFVRLGLIARSEGQIAEQQTQQTAKIADRTMNELPARFEGDEQALGYIEEAVESARRSLEELGLGSLLEEKGGE